MSSSFLGQWDKQLALLLVGAKISPERFADDYAKYRAAAATAWLPPWASALDPITQYYKFNLSHAWATLLMTYETEPGPARAGYQYAVRRAAAGDPPPPQRVLRPPPDPGGAAGRARGRARRRLRRLRGRDDGRPDPLDAERVPHAAGRAGRARSAGRRTPTARWPWPSSAGCGPTACSASSRSTARRSAWPSPRCRSGRAAAQRQDYMWQKDPFTLAAGECACPARGIGGPPGGDTLATTGASPRREGPGVDYLLAYWMAVYLGVLPPDALEPPRGQRLGHLGAGALDHDPHRHVAARGGDRRAARVNRCTRLRAVLPSIVRTTLPRRSELELHRVGARRRGGRRSAAARACVPPNTVRSSLNTFSARHVWRR